MLNYTFLNQLHVYNISYNTLREIQGGPKVFDTF